jgi:hypothetical protein
LRAPILALFTGLLIGSCDAREDVNEVPFPVSVTTLRWHETEIPKKLLVLRGYYLRKTASGAPQFYSTEMDARMSNSAEAFTVSLLPDNRQDGIDCVDGYMKAFGYLDIEYGVFRVFVMSAYDAEWQETSPCWSTTFDWQNSAEFSHLAP